MIYALLLLLGIAFRQFRQTMRLLRNGERAKARVLALVTVRDDEGISYRPVFGFVTKTNETKKFEYKGSANPPSWKIGEEADLIYHPDKPEQARLIDYWGLFVATIVLTAIAAPFIVIGGGYFLYVAALKNLAGGG